MATPYIITIGAGIQDVFLSQSDKFSPVCANPNDCFLRLDLGVKVNVNNINFSTGGGATNAAVTFARQGLRSSFMGTVGHDPAGQAVLTDLTGYMYLVWLVVWMFLIKFFTRLGD